MSRSSELLARARALLAARLSPASLQHCERTAAAAAGLARRYGVDEADAELAGLLHDYARDETDAELLRDADDLGIGRTEFETEHPYLLHARVGAAKVWLDLPGVGHQVVSAIQLHTVGGVPMSDLDRIVYLADMIEPGRSWEGVAGLREACEAGPLAECFRLGYAQSMRHVHVKGRKPHPISHEVTAAIEAETGTPLFDPKREAS